MRRAGCGQERQVNIRFLARTNHYAFEPAFRQRVPLRRRGAPGSSPMAQGQVEKNVQAAGRQILHGVPGLSNLDALNAWLEQHCLEQWQETPHGMLTPTIANV